LGTWNFCFSKKKLYEEASIILEEYLSNNLMNEFDKSIRNLNAPSFSFQIVRIAIKMAVTKSTSERKKLLDLLAECLKENLFSTKTIWRGYKLVIDEIEDLKLDAPHASEILKEIQTDGTKNGWLVEEK